MAQRPGGGAPGDERPSKQRLATRLEAVRARTLDLLEPLSDEQLTHQPGPEMGVVLWDVGHIGAFEEVWLVNNLSQGERSLSALGERFDPIAHPRAARGEMALPSRQEMLNYLRDVRKRSLDLLDQVDLASDDPLVRHGFVHDMIIRHEQQHQENMLITLQMFGGETTPAQGPVPQAYTPSIREPLPEARVEVSGMVEVPGGTYPMGTEAHAGAYDNEKPQHDVELETYWIDRGPVTNRDYLAFIEDGGYDQQAHWSTDGWLIKDALDWQAPRYWKQHEDGWVTRTFDHVAPVVPDAPVVHVSYHEAEAYANWAGKRLPTEAEWEIAASWDPEAGTKHRYPWGEDGWTRERANLGQRGCSTAPVGAYPDGASSLGCYQMAGDVWEWTSSVFSAYPGFEPFPYPEYSQDHFDMGYQVLRGGSFATWPDCATTTFRNWHQADHRQLFAGFRCASSEAPG